MIDNKNQAQAQLWDLLKSIPSGKVVSYAWFAQKLQTSPRVVGNWLHKNESPTFYPCHRVVRSDRTLATGFAFGGKEAQKKLLVAEGVKFDNLDKVGVEYFL